MVTGSRYVTLSQIWRCRYTCEKYVESWNEFKPELRKWFGDEIDTKPTDIMFEYTGFPIVSHEAVHEQLKRLAKEEINDV